VAIFKIHEAYVDNIESKVDTSVVDLTRILLEDFDTRYQPSTGGHTFLKVRLEEWIDTWVYVSISSFLLPMLSVIMSEPDYKRLKDDLIKKMSEKSKSLKRNIDSAPSSSEPAREKRLFGKAKKTERYVPWSQCQNSEHLSQQRKSRKYRLHRTAQSIHQ